MFITLAKMATLMENEKILRDAINHTSTASHSYYMKDEKTDRREYKWRIAQSPDGKKVVPYMGYEDNNGEELESYLGDYFSVKLGISKHEVGAAITNMMENNQSELLVLASEYMSFVIKNCDDKEFKDRLLEKLLKI